MAFFFLSASLSLSLSLSLAPYYATDVASMLREILALCFAFNILTANRVSSTATTKSRKSPTENIVTAWHFTIDVVVRFNLPFFIANRIVRYHIFCFIFSVEMSTQMRASMRYEHVKNSSIISGSVVRVILLSQCTHFIRITYFEVNHHLK